ncbi:hypothetical protein Axi01nite_87780 [Actinoplanes xinjiangensis]|nr:hypothetical protein Axi01nite_87780 [Actinoplanes xinjiangensis]
MGAAQTPTRLRGSGGCVVPVSGPVEDPPVARGENELTLPPGETRALSAKEEPWTI